MLFVIAAFLFIVWIVLVCLFPFSNLVHILLALSVITTLIGIIRQWQVIDRDRL